MTGKYPTAFYTFVVAVISFSPASSLAQEPVSLDQGKQIHSLAGHLATLEDPERKLTVEQVDSGPHADSFVKSESETPNFGFTSSAYWIRLDLHNQVQERIKLILEVGYAALDRIEVYVKRRDGSYTKTVSGDTLPYGGKAIRHFNFLFPLQVDAEQHQRIYMRVTTFGAMQVPLKLWTPEAFFDHDRNRQILYGIYFGILSIMVLYNLFLFFAIRDRSYLFYVVFVSSALVYQFSFDGLTQEYLWPALPWWGNRAMPFSIACTELFATLFARDFLNTRRLLPRWYKAFSIMAAIYAVTALLSLFLPYNTIIVVVSVFAFFAIFSVLILPVLSWRKGFAPARYFFAAWVAVFLGIFLVTCNKFGWIPRTPLLESGHEIGFVLNVILLSFALADRINTMRIEKQKAQAEALALQHQAAEILEAEVEKKTIDLQKRTKEAEEAREEVKRAYDRLSEYDRLKSRFFSNVSHELRTPLTLILAPLSRMLESNNKHLLEEFGDKLSSMQRNTQRLLRLVNQLLDFSRLESGAMKVNFERYDLRTMLEPIVQAFEPFARSKGLRLELRGPDDLPEVYIDPGKLDKVMCNLLSNACKFTEEGGVIVVRMAREGDDLTITVKDTGIGIAEEDLERIFDRFGQVDVSSARKYEGTGIGLALSKELLDVTGGKLDVKSEVGFGSTFTVTLPLGLEHIPEGIQVRDGPSEQPGAARAEDTVTALAAEVGIDDKQAKAEAGETETMSQKDRPLLVVVEDNADMRALVSEICKDEFRVIEAVDGRKGLEVIRKHKPALIISDIMMPGMDGNELLRHVRQDPEIATIPLMLLTAKAGPELKLEGLERGADDYLTKPFESRELLARARNLVRLQSQERELRVLNMRLQQEVVSQTAELERTQVLRRFLPPAVIQGILDHGQEVQAEQQRYRITVFRMELRGFDDLVEVIEPEDMAAMLNVYLSEMMEVAFSCGATVDKFNRDTIMGFFGAPNSEGPATDATACARMALEMWERAVKVCKRWLEFLDEQPPVPTMVLTSGTATVGFFGSSNRMEYTAIGGPVDEANDLLPLVVTGEVICTNATWTLIQQEIECEYGGEVSVRHRSRPMRVYRLAGPPTELTDSRRTHPSSQYPPVESLTTEVSPEPPSITTRDVTTGTSVDQLERGMVLADRYKIIRRLGAGGMGTVYQVRDLKLSADVALKLVKQALRQSEKSKARLYREVRLARLLSHPNIARIYDLSEWNKFEFFTMEYIQGQTLSKMIKRGKIFSLDEGQKILLQLCEGLSVAHAARVVHRDLKPSNIILDRNGRAVILDFGIARGDRMTQTGTETDGPVGTPFYMAPEQFTGDRVDHRADIYALGVIAYEMFTGQRPFQADSAVSMAYKHAHEPPPDPQLIKEDIPPRLAAVILCCLEKSPDNRFGSVREITALLTGVKYSGTSSDYSTQSRNLWSEVDKEN